MTGCDRQAIPGKFKAGNSLGSVTSRQEREIAKNFTKGSLRVAKATDFDQLIENTELNADVNFAQSQEALWNQQLPKANAKAKKRLGIKELDSPKANQSQRPKRISLLESV